MGHLVLRLGRKNLIKAFYKSLRKAQREEFESRLEDLVSGAVAERFGALGARTDAAEMVVGVDAGGVAVGKGDLNGVIPYLCSGFGTRLRLEHGQCGRRSHSWCDRLEGFLF